LVGKPEGKDYLVNLSVEWILKKLGREGGLDSSGSQ